ncbi:hypothetical protein D3C80_1988970 [compost metagenome]
MQKGFKCFIVQKERSIRLFVTGTVLFPLFKQPVHFSEMGLYPGGKLLNAEGFGHVIICSYFETDDFINVLITRT